MSPKNQRMGKRIAREIHLNTRNRKLPKKKTQEIPIESIKTLTSKQNKTKTNQSPRQLGWGKNVLLDWRDGWFSWAQTSSDPKHPCKAEYSNTHLQSQSSYSKQDGRQKQENLQKFIGQLAWHTYIAGTRKPEAAMCICAYEHMYRFKRKEKWPVTYRGNRDCNFNDYRFCNRNYRVKKIL